jgi:tetratricopeptide (TPR) repeat protein
LARVQRASGAPREAVSSLARALASAEAEAQDELHVALALVHLDLDDVAAACAVAERAVALAPGSADALQVLGLCRLAEQDTAAALQALEQAREAAPGRADIANNLGRARYVAGDYRGAQAEFQNALELDPDLEVAKSNLELAGAARASSPLAAAAGGRSAGGTVATMARDGRPGLELRDGRNPSTGWSATEVIAVVAGANAERAGLRLGDWILRAGGERVTRGETLLARLAALRPGQHLRLDVLRDAQPLAIDYLLADIQGPQSPAPPVP